MSNGYFYTRYSYFDAIGSQGLQRITVLIERDSEGYASRQVYLLEDGRSLLYDRSHCEDEYAGLAEKSTSLEEAISDEGTEIVSESLFESAWSSAHPSNRFLT